MMRRTVAVVWAVLAILTVSNTAAAQGDVPVILTLDQEQLIMASRAGQSINDQLQALGEAAATELQAEEQKIQAESDALKASQDSLSKDDFGRRYQALLEKGRSVEQLRRIREAELQQAQMRALQDLAERWQPVVREIVSQRQGTVLLERQAVLFATDTNDITADVIARLDAQVQTITVVKPDLEAQFAAQAQQQQ